MKNLFLIVLLFICDVSYADGLSKVDNTTAKKTVVVESLVTIKQLKDEISSLNNIIQEKQRLVDRFNEDILAIQAKIELKESEILDIKSVGVVEEKPIDETPIDETPIIEENIINP